jgi:signal peptidase I
LIRRWIFLIALGLGGAWILRHYLIETVSVASGSMEPTLSVDTHFIVWRPAYWNHGPLRGDIISFVSPVDQETPMIKRVIAVPGDQIELRNKQVIVNGQALIEAYAIHKRAGEILQGDNIGPLTVPERCVFVLGDNRDVSDDSANWHDVKTGTPIYFLPETNIIGRLIIP